MKLAIASAVVGVIMATAGINYLHWQLYAVLLILGGVADG